MFNRHFGFEEEYDLIPEMDIGELENEEQNKPLVLLERIDRIVKIHSFMKNSRESKGKDSSYQKTLDEHLAVCSDILGISALQTLLFTYILNSGSLSLGHLANSLKVTRIQCFKYLDDLDVLLNKRLIRKSGRGGGEMDSAYWIPYEVIQSLHEGKVFTPLRYRDLSKNVPVPILLLNEADAIINKRKDTSTSSVAQTENAIQNIILEELEKLNGIMIATTNLTENFDTAFERRFIYKIEFQKPDVEIRRLIWRSLIPELKEGETIKLAEAFDLSGGQIENIARKRTIVGILSGKDPVLADLLSFCDEESILKNDPRIGF